MHAIMRFVLRLFNVLRISQSLIVMSFRIFSWFSQTLCAHRWSNPLRCAFNPSRPSILAVEVVALEAHALRHILRKDMQTKYILDGWYDREWYDGTRLPCFSFPTLAVSWKRFISCQQTVLTGLDIPPLGSFHFASQTGPKKLFSKLRCDLVPFGTCCPDKVWKSWNIETCEICNAWHAV